MEDAIIFPNRKNPRLSGYDYSTPNYYFVTVCTHDKQCIFGMPEKQSYSGRIADQAIRDIPQHFRNVRIDKYVVMPNHVHMIVILEKDDTNLSVVIGQYKSQVTKQIHVNKPECKVWQTSFHDHIIRSVKSYEKIWQYIDTNPAKWAEDCFYVNFGE